MAICEEMMVMRFHQKNELQTIFNVQECTRQRAPFLAYLHERGGMPY